MSETVDSLGNKLSSAFRKSAASQAESYREYGVLLDRFAKRDIKMLDFAREALDLYIDAVGDLFNTGAKAAGDTFDAGIRRVGIGRAKVDKIADGIAPAFAPTEKKTLVKPAK